MGQNGPSGHPGGLCKVGEWGQHQAPARPGRKGQPRTGVAVKGKKSFFLYTRHSDTKRVGFPHQAMFQSSVVTNRMSYNLILKLTARVSTDLKVKGSVLTTDSL